MGSRWEGYRHASNPSLPPACRRRALGLVGTLLSALVLLLQGSACEVGLKSASGILPGGVPHLAAPRPTWEPSSTMAASRSQPVSPSARAGPAGSCAATSASATAMSHVVSPSGGCPPFVKACLAGGRGWRRELGVAKKLKICCSCFPYSFLCVELGCPGLWPLAPDQGRLPPWMSASLCHMFPSLCSFHKLCPS